jgi:hypothetical protein
MNTVDFLHELLPASGLRCVVSIGQGSNIKQEFFYTNDQAAERIVSTDARGRTAYHACATYHDNTDPSDPASKITRTADNVAAVRALWLDVDVGPSLPYQTASQAGAALHQFIADTKMPTPLVVRSGNGLHVYWMLTDEVSGADWKLVAEALKAATLAAGFIIDRKRTGDVASILRPPGTTHRKDPANPRPVRALSSTFERETLVTIANILGRFNARMGAVVPTLPVTDMDQLGPAPHDITASYVGPNSDLSAGVSSASGDFDPSYPDLIADSCAVMARLRDAPATAHYPEWYAGLGVLAFCEDGEAVAHAWSRGHIGYRESKTRDFLDNTKQYGPTKCVRFHDALPDVCSQCPHWRKITSPIQLGRVAPVAPAPVARVALAPGRFAQSAASASAAPTLTTSTATRHTFEAPDGYIVSPSGGVIAPFKKADGTVFTDKILDGWMQAVALVDVSPFDGTAIGYFVRIAHLKRTTAGQEVVQEFMLDCALLGGAAGALMTELGKHAVFTKGPQHQDAVKRLLTHQVDLLRKAGDEVMQQTFFGWRDRNFALGDRLITPLGPKQVVLGGAARGKGAALEPKGDLQVWVDLVARAYNHPGQEALQFLVLCGFASPIFAMLEDLGGVTVFTHTAGSGFGKTTAGCVALSIWGDHRQLMMSHGKTTINAFYELISTYHSLPALYDELTNMKKEEAGDMVYAVSAGSPKERLDSNSELKRNNGRWQMILMATGNIPLGEKLALNRANSEAEQMRLFEFNGHHDIVLTPTEAAEIIPAFAHNYGHAGVVFAEYLVANYDKVQQTLRAVRAALSTKHNFTSSERYWSALMASIVVALKVTTNLGLVSFDAADLQTWMLSQMGRARVVVQENIATRISMVGELLQDLTPGVFVTEGIGDLRIKRPAYTRRKAVGKIVGRMVLAHESDVLTARPMVWIAHSAIAEWCAKKNISMQELRRCAIEEGVLDDRYTHEKLGRGTIDYADLCATKVRIWSIFVDDEAVALSVIQGGLSDVPAAASV